jgi:uncharacterized repeat protein (TIGR02543 family)
MWSGSVCPQVKLTVTSSDVDGGTTKLSWTLEYVAHGYAANIASARPYTVTIAGTTYTGTFDIDGITSTKTIRTGTLNVAKDTSSKSKSFSVSFDFDLTWSGVYKGTHGAAGSISVPAKTSYTIKFNPNYSGATTTSVTKWYNTNITTPAAPIRTGYTFNNWKDTTDSKTYAAKATYSTNASRTLNAQWTAKTYTITYDDNGGSLGSVPPTATKTYNVDLTLPTAEPTRTNYTFLGWSTSKTATTATYKAGAVYKANATVTLYAVWQLSYKKPRITSMSVARTNSSGTASDSGTCARVKFSWACDKTVSSIVISWTPVIGSTSSTTITASGTSGSVDKTISNVTFDADTTYYISAKVTDSGGNTTVTKPLTGTKFVIDLLSSGNGISFGKSADKSGYADFNFDAMFRKPAHFANNQNIYGVKPDGTEIMAFSAQNDNGNTVIGYGNYAAKSGNTNVYGNDVTIGVANIPTATTYRPYRRAGDTISVAIKTAGYVTNSGKDVTFVVPLTTPIVGSATVSASSGNGFTLRQDAKYTHGSSATVYSHPESYSCAIAFNVGVYVTAHFSEANAAINVINNDAIGIYWSGTITLS